MFSTRLAYLFPLLVLVAGCPQSMNTDTGGPGTDTGTIDAPRTDTPGADVPGLDAPVADVPGADVPGADVPTRDTPGCVPSCTGRECGDDGCGGSCGMCLSGATCDAAGQCDCPRATCGTATCGVSSCGRDCGRCDPGTGCFMGACTPVGMCPGTPCTDRRGNVVCEGASGLGSCTTDPDLDAVCVCTGGGGSLSCATCIPDAPTPGVGSACTTPADCPDGLPCTLSMCGEPCGPGLPPCADGVCYVPGDVSGVCLDECACDVSGDCEPGTECVDALGTPVSACVSEAHAMGRMCTRSG